MSNKFLTKERKFFGFGFFLVFSGIFLNEFFLAKIFSPDGTLLHINIILIQIFDAILVLSGVIFIFIPSKSNPIQATSGIHSQFNIFILIFLIFNISIISIFFVLRWNPNFHENILEMYFVNLGFSIAILAWIFSWKREDLKPIILLLNVSFSLLIVFFCFFEIFFSFFPQWIPNPLLQINPSLIFSIQEREDLEDFFDDNPWVKFKANKHIMSKRFVRGYRGEDFTYDWETDRNGFKNLPEVANSTKIDAIAIGDSFTEGMGVRIEETWTSQLSKNYLVTYNLGVQSYAPIQMIGALKKWGYQFHPKWVFFGYTPGFEDRDIYFEGGTRSFNSYMKEKRGVVKNRFFEITNACLDLLEYSLKKNKKLRLNNPIDSQSIFYPYYDEIANAADIKFDNRDRGFQSTVGEIIEGKRVSENMSSKMVVLIFAHRALAYYEPALGAIPPEDHFELAEARELKKICKENGIDSIDLQVPIINYLNNINNGNKIQVSQLPYFKMDGHMNKIGQELIMKTILEYLDGVQTGGN